MKTRATRLLLTSSLASAPRPSFTARHFVLRGFFGFLMLAWSAWAAEATGSINGRVYNPATKQFVRNAEVRIEGTAVVTTSEDGGYFRLTQVPAGTASVTVAYAGYATASKSVNVVAGTSVAHDLEILPLSDGMKSDPGVVKLSAFVVSSELEGNAKQIMNRRNNLTMGTSIASDVFGDVTEGNVGEFLKYLPGVELETVEADTRGPRLGGMDPQYTGFSVDGQKSASADGFGVYSGTDNGSPGSNYRAFSFEAISINSIESIDIHRVTPAYLDADAPAGTIDLKTKRAFDRKGRLFSWSAGFGLNSEEFTLKKTPGPKDALTRKIKPTLSLNYADVFLNGRLGILFGLSESNLYNEQFRQQNAYGTGTGAAAGVPVVTSIIVKDGPKWTERTTGTLTADFKATDRLVLSLNTTLNRYEAYIYNRLTTFAIPAGQLAGSDYRTIRSSGVSVTPGNANINKQTYGITVVPKFEYKWGSLTIDGAYSVSTSKNTYGTLRRGIAGTPINALTGVTLEATRSDAYSSAWAINQTGGPDWADLFNYKNPRVNDDVRYVYNEVNTPSLNAKWASPLGLPATLRFGVKRQERITYSARKSNFYNYTYVGPGGGATGSYAGFPTPFVFDPAPLGVTFKSISGGGAPAYSNRDAIGALFVAHPEYFSATPLTAANYFSAAFGDTKRITETIPAAYVSAQTRLGAWELQAGVRFERTQVAAEEFDPVTTAKVLAAGFPVNTATDQATTIPGMDYQYRTKPKVIRRGSYDNSFPSIGLKYRFSDRLMADLGAGKTILRPYVNDLTGVLSIDPENEIITASNPKLKPEQSDRLAASFSYFLPKAGILSVLATETHVKNFTTVAHIPAPEFGITDPQLASYDVITKLQGPKARRFRNLELEYRQALKLLPALFDHTTVNASYTRTTVNERVVGVSPVQLKGGFDLRIGRLGFGLQGIWQDRAPWITGSVLRYRRENLKLDGNLNVSLTRNTKFFIQAKNITNESLIVNEVNTRALYKAENYGSNWVFGIRGTF